MAQTFRDFEIVIIDDGSTDNTREVVSAFPVRYTWQENEGPPKARNKGIEMAQGDYITFLDSDDEMLEHSLEKGVSALDNNPEAGFSHGQVYNMDDSGNIFGLERPRAKHSGFRKGIEEITDFLVFGNHVISSSIMIRKSCIDNVGWCDTAFRSGSVDLDLWIRLAKKYGVVYIPEPLAKFRLHAESFCAGRDLDEWERTNSAIMESVFDDIELGHLFRPFRKNAYFRLYSALADRACRRGQRALAQNYLRKAWSVYSFSLPKDLLVTLIVLLAKTSLPKPVISLGRLAKRGLVGNSLRREGI
jgi:glycosyltransferase involved in cell wall biosynthesis